MSFAVPPDAYDRFIGRYSRPLAPRFLQFTGIAAGPVLDVGCGPGSLTEVLASRFGASNVAAVDLSEPFVAACRARVPGADVRRGRAEALPFGDGVFEGALSQLVLSFVPDPGLVLTEMSRVVKAGGTVAGCTFEAGGFELMRTFWEAAHRFDAAATGDARLPLRRLSEFAGLWQRAGLRDVRAETIEVRADYQDFDDLWSPFSFGIGPAGSYFVAQPESRRAAIGEACFELLGRPPGAFSLGARVIAVRGAV